MDVREYVVREEDIGNLADALAAFSRSAYHEDFQCSPALKTLDEELLSSYLSSAAVTVVRFGAPDTEMSGFSIINNSDGRVLWLQTIPVDSIYVEATGSLVEWVLNDHPTLNFTFGLVLNPYLLNLMHEVRVNGQPIVVGNDEDSRYVSVR